MASTKLAFLAVAVLLVQASWCAMALQARNAVMTLTSFKHGDPTACGEKFDHNKDYPLAVLSTSLYADGSRCQKQIRITCMKTVRTMVAWVVDECGRGCKTNEISTSKAVWDALGLHTDIGEVPITWCDSPC